MYLHFDTARQERMKSERLAETKEAVKDAVGAFAILAMLYVGLFIPNNKFILQFKIDYYTNSILN